MDQWLIVTIIVVMCAQLSVGSFIQKSYVRFLGTLCGSILALLTLLLFGQNQIATAFAVATAAIFFSYVATGEKNYSDAGTLGAVTVVIILISNNPTPLTAFERFLEISVGILIAALISQFILPMHARKHLRETQAATIKKLRAFYLATLFTDQTQEKIEEYQTLDESIAQSLIKQRKLAMDAEREPLGGKFNLSHFQQLLYSEKEILRSIVVMHHVYKASPASKKLFTKIEIVKEFHEKICHALEKISVCLGSTDKAKISIHIPQIQLLKDNICAQMKDTPPETGAYLNVFLFSAEILVKHLRKLIKLVSTV